MLDSAIWQAISQGLTCDITTIGRTSGLPRRIEIWYFVVDTRVYLTGTPGSRDWYANMLAQPQFQFHVKQGAYADLAARALPITDPAERQRIMAAVIAANQWFQTQPYSLADWVAGSPLVEVQFEDA